MKIIEIESRDWLRFTDEVNNAVKNSLIKEGEFTKVDLPKLFSILCEKSKIISQQKIKPFVSQTCGFTYSSENLEYIIWMNALLSMAWSCNIFRRKTRDGHCYNPNHTQHCTLGQEQHQILLDAVIKSFEELLEQLKSIPINTSDKG